MKAEPLTGRETEALVMPVAIAATLLDHFARFIPGRDPREMLTYVSECAAEWRSQRRLPNSRERVMASKTVTLTLTLPEALALVSAAENGTLDDAIDNIGWNDDRKRAYRRAYDKLVNALSAKATETPGGDDARSQVL